MSAELRRSRACFALGLGVSGVGFVVLCLFADQALRSVMPEAISRLRFKADLAMHGHLWPSVTDVRLADLRDPWERGLREGNAIRSIGGVVALCSEIYSVGPNGKDENGAGDDVVVYPVDMSDGVFRGVFACSCGLCALSVTELLCLRAQRLVLLLGLVLIWWSVGCVLWFQCLQPRLLRSASAQRFVATALLACCVSTPLCAVVVDGRVWGAYPVPLYMVLFWDDSMGVPGNPSLSLPLPVAICVSLTLLAHGTLWISGLGAKAFAKPVDKPGPPQFPKSAGPT